MNNFLDTTDVKYITHTWFEGSICVVLVEDRYEGKKAYIKNVPHLTEKEGVKRAMDWGSTFPLEAAKALFPERF